MKIRAYSVIDEDKLFEMMREEGAEWECYWGDSTIEKYKIALANSTATFVAYEGEELCGYVRSRDDDGFGVYIYDLLVRKSRRGGKLGRALLEKVSSHFAGSTVYVMSDVDAYYVKQGYRKEGSIFVVYDGGHVYAENATY